MSHFTVLIAADNKTDLEKKLEPYYEQGSSTDYFMKFEDKEEEWREEWETETKTMMISPEGDLYEKYDKCFEYIPDPESPWQKEYKYPEGYEEIDFPLTQVYKTFEDYVRLYHGKKERPYGYWHNPDAKWDWWQVGGRWTGSLQLKPEIVIEENIPAGNGEPGVLTEPNYDPSKCDWTLAKYVDWENMLGDQLSSVMRNYKIYQEALASIVFPKNEYSEEEQRTIEGAKKTWNLEDERGSNCRSCFKTEDDYVKSCLADMELFNKGHHQFFDTFETSADRMYKTEKEYEEMFCGKALTFAYIDKEGKWHERAEMGWWAITTDENDNYDKDFWSFVTNLDPDQRVYVVDCHI